jgi:hypothetical protein
MNKIAQAHAEGLIKPGEFWFGVLDFPDYLFEASGRVLSLVKRPRILRPGRRGEYPGISLRHRDGKSRSVYVHRIMAEIAHGPCPSGHECRHLDGDRDNADIANLRWGTPIENASDKLVHGTHSRGERNGVAKLTFAQVAEMRAIRARNGMPYHAIADLFGVSTMTAYRAVTHQSWSY